MISRIVFVHLESFSTSACSNCEGSDRLRVHSVQDFSPNDFRGQRFDLVRAEVPCNAAPELCAVQKNKEPAHSDTSAHFRLAVKPIRI